MVFRLLMHLFSNNERVIQRLSESYPVRRAAQLVVLIFHRSKGILEDNKVREKLAPEQLKSYMQKFSEDFKKELKQAQEQAKKSK